jgi:hypothetical protein
MNFDENGWARGAVGPLAPGEAWTLLSPEPDARVDAARWAHQAEKFFRVQLAVVQEKRYPAGTLPIADRVEIDVAIGAETTRLLVVTVPADRAPEALAAGAAGARAIGGAGFDALVLRTKRVWQVREQVDAGDARAPLVVAAVLASLFLAPIVPPAGGTIFGVKGARERLAAQGSDGARGLGPLAAPSSKGLRS